MEIDYSAWRFWFDVAQFLLTCSIGVYVWFSSRQRVTKTRIKELEEEISVGFMDHHTRLTKMESDFSHLPGVEEMAKLSSEISGLSRELGNLKGRLSGINRAVDLINDHLINRSKG